MQLTIDQLKAENAQLRSNLDAANTRIQHLEALVKKQSKDFDQLAARLDILDEENKKLKLKLRSVNGDTSSDASSGSPPLIKN